MSLVSGTHGATGLAHASCPCGHCICRRAAQELWNGMAPFEQQRTSPENVLDTLTVMHRMRLEKDRKRNAQ